MKDTKQLRRIATALEGLQPAARPRDTARAAKKDKPGWRYRFAVWVRCSDKKSARATRRRRSVPIMAYVGPNGGGKSLAMVKDSIASLDRGRPVLSTVRLLDSSTGTDHPLYVRFTDWDQLLNARDCDVLMDEMVGIAGARESLKLDVDVQNVLVQLRRRNVVLRWSAPSWTRADKIVREVTQAVTVCTGHYSDRRAVRAGDDGAVQLWAPKRLFNFRTYDTIDFDEWTTAKTDKVPSSVSEWFVGPGSRAFASYDTYDAVERVTGMTSDGRCPDCGKLVRREYCKGHDARASHEHETIVRDLDELSSGLDFVDELTGEVVRVPAEVAAVGR